MLIMREDNINKCRSRDFSKTEKYWIIKSQRGKKERGVKF